MKRRWKKNVEKKYQLILSLCFLLKLTHLVKKRENLDSLKQEQKSFILENQIYLLIIKWFFTHLYFLVQKSFITLIKFFFKGGYIC